MTALCLRLADMMALMKVLTMAPMKALMMVPTMVQRRAEMKVPMMAEMMVVNLCLVPEKVPMMVELKWRALNSVEKTAEMRVHY